MGNLIGTTNITYNHGFQKAVTTGGNGEDRIGLIIPTVDICFLGENLHRLGHEGAVAGLIDSSRQRPRRTRNGHTADVVASLMATTT